MDQEKCSELEEEKFHASSGEKQLTLFEWDGPVGGGTHESNCIWYEAGSFSQISQGWVELEWQATDDMHEELSLRHAWAGSNHGDEITGTSPLRLEMKDFTGEGVFIMYAEHAELVAGSGVSYNQDVTIRWEIWQDGGENVTPIIASCSS